MSPRPRLAIAQGVTNRALEAMRLTPTGGAAIGLVVVGWGGARLIGSRTAYLMVYAAVLAVVLSWFVSRQRLALTVERSALPTRMRADQVAGIELTIAAQRRATTILIDENIDPALGGVVTIPVASMRAGDEFQHTYSITPQRRGVFLVGPTVASWSDPFGLTTHHQELAPAVEVIVHPAVEPVHDRVLTRMWEDPPVRPPASKPWPVGFEFYGMRDYTPGDDLRRVVWSALAKTGRLLVRESEQGITDRVVVYLDTGRAHHSPGETSETFEAAVRTAASVGVRHLEEGFSLTLLTNGGRLVESARGSGSQFHLLDALAKVGLDDGSITDIGPVLRDETMSRPHILVITPRLSPRDGQRLKSAIDMGVSVTVAQVTWDESDPHTLPIAAANGCEVVRISSDASLQAVFANQFGAGVR